MRKLAECIHGMIVKSGLNENVTIATGLLDLYAKLGRLTYSLKIFGEVNNPDKGAWTAMLAAYAVHGYGREAMELFESMLKEGGEPDHVTFTHLQSDCSHSGLVEVGKNDFNIMPQVYGIEPRLDHYSCMVGLLGRSGLLNDAYELIRRLMVMLNLGRKLRRYYFLWTRRIPETISMLSNMYFAAGSWRDA
ncbi:hypothetical protein DVH24_030463 [Malus domestica]|uniref:Pentatricopeptide repeat-containing protein n=1 Tax=Malus domestica TaxID=3750 RepID=A0A498K2K1_MALDO|nr:hypothetical protein DVH24_030463 [Malus domestica]